MKLLKTLKMSQEKRLKKLHRRRVRKERELLKTLRQKQYDIAQKDNIK